MSMTVRPLTALLVASSLALVPVGHAQAAAPSATEQRLLDLLDQQEQRIRVLERKLELQQEAATAAAATTPVVAASPKGFSFRSADSANSLRLRGVIQLDGRDFLDNTAPDGSNTWILRRERPIIEGTVSRLFDYRFTPDFASGRTVIQDAYVTHKFRPEFTVQAGKFKTPFGLERLQSAQDLRFVERSLANNLVPNRDLGINFAGDLLGGKLNYAFAYLNGVGDGASAENNPTADVDANDDKDLALRLSATPFRDSDFFALQNLTIGLGTTWANGVGTATKTLLPAQYRSPGQQSVFTYRAGATPTIADGRRLRWSPQFYWANGGLGLLGEYVAVSQDVSRTIGVTRRASRLEHRAWQLQGSWFLTGEDESFRTPVIKHPYVKGGDGWGALELTARVNKLSLDDETFTGGANSFADPLASIRDATAWALGVNWYLNQNIKWTLNYEQTQFDGGAAGGLDRPDEQVVLGRVQLAF